MSVIIFAELDEEKRSGKGHLRYHIKRGDNKHGFFGTIYRDIDKVKNKKNPEKRLKLKIAYDNKS